MSVGNGEEPLNSRHACAACKHQRRKCEKDCVLAPHFPANKANSFREVHNIFGVKNAIGILEHLSSQDRKTAVESLEWEAFAWKKDPIQGPLGLYRKQEQELELLKNQPIPQQNIIMPYQNSAGIDVAANTNVFNATDFGYANNPNLGLGLIMNNYAGFVQRAENSVSQGLLSYYPGVPNYPAMLQGQGRSVILQERGLDAVAAQATALLPKQEWQGNQILDSSAMRPTASFKNIHADGSKGRGPQPPRGLARSVTTVMSSAIPMNCQALCVIHCIQMDSR